MIINKTSALIDAIYNPEINEIIITEGAYRIDTPLVISNRSQELTIKGEGLVTLTATKLVEGHWAEYKDGIFVTDVGVGHDIQAVYSNDKMQIMCRFPNYTEDEILNGCSCEAISHERISSWKNPSTGYMRAIHKNDWGGNSYIIKGKTPSNNLDLHWIGDNNRGKDFNKNKVMVEHIFEELDTPKEWFYDKTEGLLYLMPEIGVDANTCTVEFSTSSDLFIIDNSQNITFENITFAKTNRTMFNSKYIFVTRSDWGVAERGAILLNNTRNINIKKCVFDRIGGNCIYFKNRNRDCSVTDCEFINTGASGIIIYGNQSACRNLSTWEGQNHKTYISDYTKGAKNDLFSKDITIKDCYFYNTGIFEKQSAPISLSVSKNITIKGNTIHHVPRAGINICDGTFGGHVIEDNDIFDTIRETGDHGPFNSWGRDRFWSLWLFNTTGAFGRSKKRYCKLDAIETTIINHNRISGNRGFGIDLDDGSTNYDITNNFCNGVGIKIREGFFRTIRNNILINAPLDIHCTFRGCDDVIENNIISCANPINICFLNKGWATKFTNNYLVNCDKKCMNNKIIVDKSINTHISKMKIPELLLMDFDGFNKISLDFGRSDKPNPDFDYDKIITANKTAELYGSQVMNIDETTRSVGGLKDYDGVYIDKINKGKLKSLGFKNGDTILSINSVKINNIDQLITYNDEWKNIIIRRNQKDEKL